jgi:two-component system response regulator LytT
MKILIVEDESRIAARIERMARSYFGPETETTKFDNIFSAVSYLNRNRVDLVLLDLNLNGESGFDVLQSVTLGPYHTIVVSAYTDQAITAFQYGVIDFVPKPFDENRLHQAFGRLSQKQVTRTTYVSYLGSRKAGTIQFVDIEKVLFIKGAGIYTELCLANGETALCDKSLEQLMQLLPPGFIRTHKSYIVPLKNMLALQVSSGSRYQLQLKSGESLAVGRSRISYLKAQLLL